MKRRMTLCQAAPAALQCYQTRRPPLKASAGSASKRPSLSTLDSCTPYGYTVVREHGDEFEPRAASRQRETVAVLTYGSAGKGRELGRLELTKDTRVHWGAVARSQATGGRA